MWFSTVVLQESHTDSPVGPPDWAGTQRTEPSSSPPPPSASLSPTCTHRARMSPGHRPVCLVGGSRTHLDVSSPERTVAMVRRGAALSRHVTEGNI